MQLPGCSRPLRLRNVSAAMSRGLKNELLCSSVVLQMSAYYSLWVLQELPHL